MKTTSTENRITLMEGDATTPAGFKACGLHCGARLEHKDLALLWCETKAAAAGMFTTNQVVAAPVQVCKHQLRSGYSRGVVINSGNANACTGEQGFVDAWEMIRLTAQTMEVPQGDLLVCSTGLIGRVLPMDKIRAGIPRLKGELSTAGGKAAAEAITTTDAFLKTGAAKVVTPRGDYFLGGMAKGAGMIHPRLATTLGFLTTDAKITPELLHQALQKAMKYSFNSITVDGDTSTNDTVLVFAGGAGGVEITEGESFELFVEALTQVARKLAKLVVQDGEGARRLVELTVRGAKDEESAKQVAETIAGSLLFKTMLVGGEPNWGRVVAAAGRSGITVQPDLMNLWFGGVQVVKQGLGLEQHLAEAGAALQAPEVEVVLDLGQGKGSSTLWTCDINEKYVVLNGSYMT